MRIFLTHVPDMLENYYGPRALAEMRKLGEVRLNETGKVLDAKALAEAAKGCEIVVSDRQTPGPTLDGNLERAHRTPYFPAPAADRDEKGY